MKLAQERDIFAAFAKYTALNILGMIGLSCYILADTFFIARGIGAQGLTALNLAIPVYSFLNGLGLMAGIGGATKYSICRGTKNNCMADQIFTQSVLIAICLSLTLAIAGIIGSEFLSHCLKARGDLLPMTNIYLKVILLFAPMFMLNNVFVCFVRNDGDPRLSMAAMLLGSLSNIVMDYIYIFPLRMGMFGAALATGTAPVVSLGVLSIHFFKRKNNFHFTKCRGGIEGIATISSLGASSLITEVSSGIVIIIFNIITMRLTGDLGVAAYGIIANIALVVLSLFTGIAQGIQPVISSNYGVGNKANIRKVYRYGIITAVVLASLTLASVLLFAEPVANLFNKEQNPLLLEIASTGMRIYFISFLFAGFNIVSAMYFSSVEQAGTSFLISILRGFFVVIPMTFLLSFLWGINGVWCAMPATELLVSAFTLIAVVRHRRNV